MLAVDLPGAKGDFSSDAIIPFDADVTADEAPDRIVRAAEEKLGGVDIVFNNAAIGGRAPVAEMTDEFWDEMFAVNLRGGVRLVRGLIPLLRQSGRGRIISTSSVAAILAVEGQAAYSTGKAGLIALTRVLALELGPDAITANAILPGVTHTGMTRDLINATREERLSARSPLGRVGVPEDIARVALFFASDDSAFVTGQALAVDGGLFIGAFG